MEKNKIVVFSQSSVGGAERMSVTITKTLDRNKFNVIYYLVGPTTNGRAPLQEFIPNDLCVHSVSTGNPLLLIVKIGLILMKERPDVVFSSVLNLNNKLLLLRNLFKKTKFVVRCDNYLYTYKARQRKIIAKTYGRADIIIAQTEEMRQELLEEVNILESKVVTLQNPVDEETIERKIKEAKNPYPQDGRKRYIASGRFAYQKGFDLLIEAFAEVKRMQPESELYIVGKKDTICKECYQEVKKLIECFGLKDSVHCVGFQANPYVYIKYADCFVLSSRWEGLPNVMIESLYLGTPVAAFKCIPVIERIVTDGVDGFTVDKEDFHALANAMVSASKLGRIHSLYKSADIGDFHNLFELASVPMLANKKTKFFNFLYHHAHNGGRIWNFFYKVYTEFILGCDIPSSTQIGEGFEIFHSAHASVISPGTIIGNNVSLRQNTTIGAKGFSGAEKSPIIQDNVTIGPNVCIIGNITIGTGATIGAGAVVVKDVPSYSVVAGNPARVLNAPNGGG